MSAKDPSDTFRLEAGELLEQLEACLLDLKDNPSDQETIGAAFRALHTLKGSGAMFGFTALAEFVHEFETAFDTVRKGERQADEALIQVALDAKDHIHALIGSPEDHTTAGVAILARLGHVTGTTVQPKAGHCWNLRYFLPGDAMVKGSNPDLLLAELLQAGGRLAGIITDRVPPIDAIDPEHCYLGWEVTFDGFDPTMLIEETFLFLREEMELSLTDTDLSCSEEAGQPPNGIRNRPETLAAPPYAQPSSPQLLTAERTPHSGSSASSLRVPAERLDELMDRVGELVIAQARLSQIAGLSADTALKTIAEELERLSSGLRDTTMGIRMVPIGTLFGRFRRLIHDLSSELGKPIEFITTGEDTELDKTMIERLADPLVHLIRNSIDHGLESADKRAAAGKPAKGVVRLSAVYSGAEVAISVTDDGAGLDAARIRAKAEENGLITPDTKLTDQELNHLIFAPGFSTAKEVTSLSGRGVGMDVVKRTIDGLRGTIDVTSKPGQGSTMTLRLPLTLAIIDGMLVRVGNGRYTIPLAAVEECVELPEGIEAHAKGRNFLDIRGALVPYLRLREVFGTRGESEPHQKVVIVSSGEGRVGLVVDQIIGNNQTVIKQLSKLHSGIKSFSGATILGDGSVALILDTAHLVAAGQGYVDRNLTGRAA